MMPGGGGGYSMGYGGYGMGGGGGGFDPMASMSPMGGMVRVAPIGVWRGLACCLSLLPGLGLFRIVSMLYCIQLGPGLVAYLLDTNCSSSLPNFSYLGCELHRLCFLASPPYYPCPQDSDLSCLCPSLRPWSQSHPPTPSGCPLVAVAHGPHGHDGLRDGYERNDAGYEPNDGRCGGEGSQREGRVVQHLPGCCFITFISV